LVDGRLKKTIVFEAGIMTGKAFLLRRDPFSVFGPATNAVGKDSGVEFCYCVAE
jgi:hypothetical protein